MTIRSALSGGFRLVRSSPRALWLTYGMTLVLSAVLALGFRSMVSNAVGETLATEKLTANFDYTVYSDFMNKFGERYHVVSSEVLWMIFISMLLSTFLAGGIFESYRHPRQTSTGAFFEACGSYLWRYLRLLLLGAVVAAVVAVGTFMVLSLFYSNWTQDAVSEVVAVKALATVAGVFLVVFGIAILFHDYARVSVFRSDERSVLNAYGRSILFVLSNLHKVLAIEIVYFLVTVAMILVYFSLESAVGMTSAGGILVLFLIQQVFVISRAGVRLAAMGSEFAYFGGVESEKRERSVSAMIQASLQPRADIESSQPLPAAVEGRPPKSARRAIRKPVPTSRRRPRGRS